MEYGISPKYGCIGAVANQGKSFSLQLDITETAGQLVNWGKLIWRKHFG
jgi:hypothetical protein